MSDFAERAIEFYAGLTLNKRLPAGVEVLNPYENQEVAGIVKIFFSRFYADRNERIAVIGINPGRFGAGITGITFTDPIRLEEECGIPNTFEKRSELSSRFVYEVIHEFGEVRTFFESFFLTAVSPLGFIKNGKNINYYDDRQLEAALYDFIRGTLRQQCELGLRRDKAICLGEGKNIQYLRKLNHETGLFAEIIPLPHPRWVMQYRYKRKAEFIRTYLNILNRF